MLLSCSVQNRRSRRCFDLASQKFCRLTTLRKEASVRYPTHKHKHSDKAVNPDFPSFHALKFPAFSSQILRAGMYRFQLLSSPVKRVHELSQNFRRKSRYQTLPLSLHKQFLLHRAGKNEAQPHRHRPLHVLCWQNCEPPDLLHLLL